MSPIRYPMEVADEAPGDGEERLKHYFKLIIVSKNQCFMNIYN